MSGHNIPDDEVVRLLERTRRSSGVPRIVTDPQALRRTAQILRSAERPARGGGRG